MSWNVTVVPVNTSTGDAHRDAAGMAQALAEIDRDVATAQAAGNTQAAAALQGGTARGRRRHPAARRAGAAQGSLGIGVRVDPESMCIEPACGAAPSQLPRHHLLLTVVSLDVNEQ